MFTRSMTRLAASVLTMLAAGAARAQMHCESNLVDPVEVTSPSGAWSLSIDPGTPSGTGPVTYRLMHGGSVAWSADLPYELHCVQLGDDGAFAGTSRADGGLRLMLLDAQGEPRVDTTLPVEERWDDAENFPRLDGILIDGAQDLAVFRVLHTFGGEEHWLPVRWSTGESFPELTLRPPPENPETTCTLSDWRLIAGAPLLLCEWAETGPKSESGARSRGTRIVLTDPQARRVWELALPHDLEAGGDERAAERIRQGMWKRVLLPCAEPRRFAVQLVPEAQRVTFEVRVDAASSTGWSVREVSREAHALESRKSGVARGPSRDAMLAGSGDASAPAALALQFLGAIELQTGASAPREPPSGDIDDRGRENRALGSVECAFVDAQGRVALADERTHAVHVFDAAGARLAVCEPSAEALGDGGRVACLAISSDGHLHAGIRHSFHAFSITDCDFDGVGAPQRDATLEGAINFRPAGTRRWVTNYDGIRLVEAEGSCAKRITRSPDNRWLDTIGEPGVAPDGSLAVISRGGLHVFAPDGTAVMSVPLPVDLPPEAHLAFTGPRVYLSLDGRLWRVDLASRAILATTLGAELSPAATAPCAWHADGGELWIVDEHAKRVLRYGDRSP